MVQMDCRNLIENLGDMGVGGIVNQLKELHLSDSESEASSDMDLMYGSGIGSYSDDLLNDTTADRRQRRGYVEDPYEKEILTDMRLASTTKGTPWPRQRS